MRAGLWDREAWYLSFEAERPLPSPLSEWTSRPAGYQYCRVEKITKEIRSLKKEVAMAFVAAAWEPPSGDEREWNNELVDGCPSWGGWAYQRRSGRLKRSKLLGLSRTNARRYLRPSLSLFERATPKIHRFGVWRPCLATRDTFVPDETQEMVEIGSLSFMSTHGLITASLGESRWSPAAPAYRSDGLQESGPILPPSDLTQRVPGRTIVFRNGPLKGGVFTSETITVV